MDPRYQKVLNILSSESNSLKDLARISDRDIFRFYNRADLSNLDLHDQDLSGLNFDYADLRNSDIVGAKLDPGALNRSTLDPSQYSMKDEYLFNIHDIISFPSQELLAFCRVREGIIDEALRLLRINYTQFMNGAHVSPNALRKARAGRVIAVETCYEIFRELTIVFSASKKIEASSYIRMFEQPCVQLLSGGQSADFNILTPERVDKLLSIRRYKIRRYSTTSRAASHLEARDTAEYLQIFEDDHDRLGGSF